VYFQQRSYFGKGYTTTCARRESRGFFFFCASACRFRCFGFPSLTLFNERAVPVCRRHLIMGSAGPGRCTARRGPRPAARCQVPYGYRVALPCLPCVATPRCITCTSVTYLGGQDVFTCEFAGAGFCGLVRVFLTHTGTGGTAKHTVQYRYRYR
jgi:hypothetical protein